MVTILATFKLTVTILATFKLMVTILATFFMHGDIKVCKA